MEVYIYSKGLYIRWALRCRAVDNGGHWICWSVALLIGLGPTACKKEGKKTWLALVFFWMVAAILTAHWMVFFFNPTFWYIQYYFLLYLISSGGRKRVRGRKRKRPAARLICFASCSAPQMVVNAVAGRQAPIREVAQTHTAAAAIMDLSLWTSSYLYGRLYGVISVWRGRTTQNG